MSPAGILLLPAMIATLFRTEAAASRVLRRDARKGRAANRSKDQGPDQRRVKASKVPPPCSTTESWRSSYSQRRRSQAPAQQLDSRSRSTHEADQSRLPIPKPYDKHDDQISRNRRHQDNWTRRAGGHGLSHENDIGNGRVRSSHSLMA